MTKKQTRLFQTIALTTILILTISLFQAAFAFADDTPPQYDTTWQVTIVGNGAIGQPFNEPKNYSILDLVAMPESNYTADLYCDGSFVTSGNWGGVTLGQLANLTQVDPQSGVMTITFLAIDSYSRWISSDEYPYWAQLKRRRTVI